MLRFGHFLSLAAFLLPLTGCPLFYGVGNVLLSVPFELAVLSQSNRQSGQLTVIGGNAERAVLGGISSFFVLSDTDELVLLDLTTGQRSAIPIGTDQFPVQTDGDYIAWRAPDYAVDTSDGIHLLDLRTGEEWQIWENGQFEGHVVTYWTLSSGRVFAEPDYLSTPDPGSGVYVGERLIYELATRQTRVVPASNFLPVETSIHGTTAFSIELVTERVPTEGGAFQLIPIETRLVETNLETGEPVTRVSYASSADGPQIFASATYIVWSQSDYDAKRFFVGYYERNTGRFGLIERDYQLPDIPVLLAAGDSGFVLRSSSSVPFVSSEVRYEFVDFGENVSEMQRRTLGGATIPIEGSAAVLGDRAIWNDPLDGQLRYYVISTGDVGTYDE